MKKRLKGPEEIDYLNPTNDNYIKLYLQEIYRIEDRLMHYLKTTEKPDDKVINWYQHEIDLKWNNVRFYKEFVMRK